MNDINSILPLSVELDMGAYFILLKIGILYLYLKKGTNIFFTKFD